MTQDGSEKSGGLRSIQIGLLAIAIAGTGILIAFWLNWTDSRSQKGTPEEESARLVETVTVERKTQHVQVRGLGSVLPARQVVIQPRVNGKIVRQNEKFVPGGHFAEGEMMVQLDQTDYRHTVSQRKSDLKQAKATLRIREGDQAVAREELDLLEGDITGGDRGLILRQPQVNQAEAAVVSAQAALAQAKTNLARTRIEAPFPGHIISRSASLGSNVSQGTQLATFVGSERYWVNVSIPVSHLRWIDVPEKPGQKGSPVRITNATAWGPDAYREGYVHQVIGQLEAGSRMAQVLIAVPDPLARKAEHEDKPSLIVDGVVDVRCQGRAVPDIVTLNQAYVRKNDTVWIMNESNRLEIRSVSVAFHGQKNAYITSGLRDGDEVVMTNLSAPVPDMRLRTVQSSESAAQEGDANRQQGANNG